MIPDGVLSTIPITTDSLYPREYPKQDLVDYDYGPVAITDVSQGLLAKVWKGQYDNLNRIVYSAEGVSPTPILQVPNVQEISITFDQNARPCVAYWNGTYSYLYWYNTLNAQFEILRLPGGCYNPRVVLDDKRQFDLAASDILLCYIYKNSLCIRYQRERFNTEHVLSKVGDFARLDNILMNSKYRVQFDLLKPGVV